MKPSNLLAFPGPHTPHLKIGDLGSCVHLNTFDVYDSERIKRCMTIQDYALMVGIPVVETTSMSLWG